MTELLFLKFSNDRNDKYKIKTLILQDDNKVKRVEKYPLTAEAVEHINNMYKSKQKLKENIINKKISINECKLHDGHIEFEFVEGQTLAQILNEKYDEKDYDGAFEIIKEYYRILEQLATETFCFSKEFENVFGKVKFNDKMKSCKVTNIDMIFNNIIVNDGKWYIIDYEWTFDFLIPINYVLYRALTTYDFFNKKIEWEKILDSLGINELERNQYKNMENKFQGYAFKDTLVLDALNMIKPNNKIDYEFPNKGYIKICKEFEDENIAYEDFEIDFTKSFELKIKKNILPYKLRINVPGQYYIITINNALVGNQNRILLHNGDNITENTILFVEKETNFAIEELIDGELLVSFDIKKITENQAMLLKKQLESVHMMEEENKNVFNKTLKLLENFEEIQTELNTKISTIEDNKSSIEKLQIELDNKKSIIYENEKIIEKLQVELNEKTSVIEDLQTELNNKILKIENDAKTIEGLSCQNMERAYEYENLKATHDALINSRFWRMTLPVRKTLYIIKKIMYSNKVTYLMCKGLMCLKRNGIKKTFKITIEYLRKDKISEYEKFLTNNNIVLSFRHLIYNFKNYDQENNMIILPELLLELDNKNDTKVVLLVSHEADLTGAPIALYRMAQEIKKMGYFPVFLAPRKNRLVEEIKKDNIPIIIYQDIYNSNWILECQKLFQAIIINTVISWPLADKLKFAKIPVIWWIHDAESPAYEMIPEKLSNNISVYSGGDHARKILLRYRPNYIVNNLLYSIPDIAKITEIVKLPVDAKDKKVFACIGTLEDRKGQDILINAIKKLKKETFDNCLFLFIGRACSIRLEAEILNAQQKYPNNILYVRELDQSTLHAMYNNIDCLICSSLDDPMPIVVTNAFCKSKLVICSENTGSAAIIEEMNAGVVYKDNDPKLLAENIEYIYNNFDNLDYMRENARKTYEKYFSNEVFRNNIKNILKKIPKKKIKKEIIKSNVSVIIPTYNAGDKFEEILNMLKSQKKIDKLEIVVVDSGSKDNTIQLCKKHKVKLIQIPNEKFSHSYARNLGAKSANGDIILFITQDAMPSNENWMYEMIDPILNEGIVAVTCSEKCPENTDLYYKVASEFHRLYLGYNENDKIGSLENCVDELDIRKNSNLNDVACAIKKSVFKQFWYRFSYGEDLDLGIRLIKSGFKLKFLSKTYVIHGHTRNVDYYLRRGIVEVAEFDRVFEREVVETKENSIVDLLIGYGIIQKVIEKISSDENVNVVNIFEKIDEACIEFSEKKPKELLQYVHNLEVVDKVGKIMNLLAKTVINIPNPKLEFEVMVHIRGYVKEKLKTYVINNNIVMDLNIKRQILDSLRKELVSYYAGGVLAHVGKDSEVYEYIDELKHGI